MFSLPIDGRDDYLTFGGNPFDNRTLHSFCVVSTGLISTPLNLGGNNVRRRAYCEIETVTKSPISSISSELEDISLFSRPWHILKRFLKTKSSRRSLLRREGLLIETVVISETGTYLSENDSVTPVS